MRKLLIVLACLSVAACADGYSSYYKPMNTSSIQFEPFQGEPQIISSTGNVASDISAMWGRGYGLIGYAAFVGPMAGVDGAIAQGKKVGAQYIVVSHAYAGTVSGAIPMTTFAPQTTYSSGTVNAYGSGGYASGNYNGTSTTYTQQTTYIPYSVQRYDQAAAFFGPLARKGIGMQVKEIDPADAQRLGTQKGLIVLAVRRGSPAFDADVLPGDVLTTIGGASVYEIADGLNRFQAAYGTDVPVTVLRAGVTIQKSIHLPVGGVWP